MRREQALVLAHDEGAGLRLEARLSRDEGSALQLLPGRPDQREFGPGEGDRKGRLKARGTRRKLLTKQEFLERIPPESRRIRTAYPPFPTRARARPSSEGLDFPPSAPTAQNSFSRA